MTQYSFVAVLALLVSFNAFAYCPKLEGKYECADSKGVSYQIGFDTFYSEDYTQYFIDSGLEILEVKTDAMKSYLAGSSTDYVQSYCASRDVLTVVRRGASDPAFQYVQVTLDVTLSGTALDPIRSLIIQGSDERKKLDGTVVTTQSSFICSKI
jgi:hypothetical protein